MRGRTSCDERTSREALEAYLKAYDNLYDRLKNESLKKFLLKSLSPIKGKKVLEVGAGGGIWTRFWVTAGAKVTSIDIHPPILLGNKMSNPKADFLVADATTAKFNAEFDIIFAKDVIEHISNDEALLANMVRHLKACGYLFIGTQNSLSLNYLLEGEYNYLKGSGSWCGWDPTHVRFYDFRQLSAKLEAAGLKPIKWWGTYHFPYRFVTNLFFGKSIEWRGFHLVELLGLNDRFPFKYVGWNIGVIARTLRQG